MKASRRRALARASMMAALAALPLLGEAYLRLFGPKDWRVASPLDHPALSFGAVKQPRLSPETARLGAPKGGAFRVVCLGGSVTAGFPFPGAGFPEWLGAILAARHPDRRVEVWNAGAGGFGSARSLVVLRQVLEASAPDLVIVYDGHNETVEQQTRAAVEAGAAARLGQSARLLLSRTALGTQALRRWAPAARSALSSLGRPDLFSGALENRLREGHGGGPLVVTGAVAEAPAPPLLEAELDRNLRAMAAETRARGVPLAVVTPINDERRLLPLVAPWHLLDGGPGTREERRDGLRRLLLAARAFEAGDCAGALRHEAGIAASVDLPVRHYVRGACHERAGRAAQARRGYKAWHEAQPTCDDGLRAVIRRAAREEGLLLVDADSAARRLGGGYAPAPFFVDDHHLTAAGYRWVAERLAAAVEAQGLLGRPAAGAPPPRLALPPRHDGHAWFLIGQMYSAWAATTDPMLGAADRFNAEAVAAFRRAVAADPELERVGGPARPALTITGEFNLGLAYHAAGRRERALEQFRRAFALGVTEDAAKRLVDLGRRDPSLRPADLVPADGDFTPLFGLHGERRALRLRTEARAAWLAAGRPRRGFIELTVEAPDELVRRGPVRLSAVFGGRALGERTLRTAEPQRVSLGPLPEGPAGLLELTVAPTYVPLLAHGRSDHREHGVLVRALRYRF